MKYLVKKSSGITDLSDAVKRCEFYHTFSGQFVVSDFNKETVSCAQAFVAGNLPTPIFYIYSECGLGASRTLQQMKIMHDALRKNETFFITDAEKFTRAYTSPWLVNPAPLDELTKHFIDVDILGIDFIQFFNTKLQISEVLRNIISTRCNKGKKTILISSENLPDMPCLTPIFPFMLSNTKCIELSHPMTKTDKRMLINSILKYKNYVPGKAELEYFIEYFRPPKMNIRFLENFISRHIVNRHHYFGYFDDQ